MTDSDVIDLTERAALLMQQRLGARGLTLAQALDSRGQRLPRKVRRAARVLAEAETLARHPRLRQRLDRGRVGAAGRVVIGYVQPLGAGERRWRLFLSILGGMAFALLVTLGGIVAVLVWRGYL